MISKPITSLALSLLITAFFINPLVSFTSLNSISDALPAQRIQYENNPCVGLDVVLLVSYNSSMNRVNDPLNLRKRAIKTGINILGDNALYLCPKYFHRLAVVAFGDNWGDADTIEEDTLTLIEPTVISPTLESLDTWTIKKNSLSYQLPEISDDASREQYTIGSGNNFSAALAKASEILRTWKSDDPFRKRAVLIISDGSMCRINGHCEFDREIRNAEPYVDPGGIFLDSTVSISHIGFYSVSGGGTSFFESSSIKLF